MSAVLEYFRAMSSHSNTHDEGKILLRKAAIAEMASRIAAGDSHLEACVRRAEKILELVEKNHE